MTATRVALVGCCGRMGRLLARGIAESDDLQLCAAVTGPDDPLIGCDIGVLCGIGEVGVRANSSIPDQPCDVAIDFSLPPGFRTALDWCTEHDVPLVSGTTGLTDEDRNALTAAAKRIAVLWAPNMSIGVNLLLALVEQATRALDATWDVEIVETHHRNKVDAPSGTAKALLAAVQDARRDRGDPHGPVRHGRDGESGVRPRGEIGMHAVRMGGVVGRHDVQFATPHEIVTLSHAAESREAFAGGALHAARWIVRQPAGSYRMRDVLSETAN